MADIVQTTAFDAYDIKNKGLLRFSRTLIELIDAFTTSKPENLLNICFIANFTAQ